MVCLSSSSSDFESSSVAKSVFISIAESEIEGISDYFMTAIIDLTEEFLRPDLSINYSEKIYKLQQREITYHVQSGTMILSEPEDATNNRVAANSVAVNINKLKNREITHVVQSGTVII